MGKLAIKIGGTMCLVLGFGMFWLPIPLGLPLMGLGLSLLLLTSPMIAAWLASLRRRHPYLDAKLRLAEPYLPRALRLSLARTRAPSLRPRSAIES